MKILVSWANDAMDKSLAQCRESAIKFGCDKLGSDVLDNDFYFFNRGIIDQDRGCGYWLWKPYFIFKNLLSAANGDVIIYSDAGVQFVGSIEPIIEAVGDQDVFLFSNDWPHHEWCKMDVVHAINGQNLKKVPTMNGEFYEMDGYEEHKQVQASNIFFRNTEWSRRFVKEWLLWCQMPGFIDDSPSRITNSPTFAEHRHDQAILTCLQIKYQIPLHWFPSTTNLHKRDLWPDRYDPIFLHHRKRNEEW